MSYKVDFIAIPIIQLRKVRHGLVQNDMPGHDSCCAEICHGESVGNHRHCVRVCMYWGWRDSDLGDKKMINHRRNILEFSKIKLFQFKTSTGPQI